MDVSSSRLLLDLTVQIKELINIQYNVTIYRSLVQIGLVDTNLTETNETVFCRVYDVNRSTSLHLSLIV